MLGQEIVKHNFAVYLEYCFLWHLGRFTASAHDCQEHSILI